MKGLYTTLLLTFLLLLSCETSQNQSLGGRAPDQAFKDYWYAGKAELNSYDLEQARYGEMREGKAVLIFVTEDWHLKKQVKLNDPSSVSDQNKVRVLKLNSVRKFKTGIYPYSTMVSTFSPVQYGLKPWSIKSSCTVQEWCGQMFSSLEKRGQQYDLMVESYFEDEDVTSERIPGAQLEDELFNLARMDIDALPIGEIELIPSLLYSRLKHQQTATYKAQATLEKKGTKLHYTVKYLNLERKLKLEIEKEFPHRILSWEEEYQSGFGNSASLMKTKATLDTTILSPYWSKNSNADEGMRKELGLD